MPSPWGEGGAKRRVWGKYQKNGAGDMSKLSNSRLTSNARNLRKNMTKEERHLWYDFLRNLPINVHRQKVIGRYIVDFSLRKQKW